MGCQSKIGSFPNTRIRSRKPTKKAKTYKVIAIWDNSAGPIDTTVEVTEAMIGQKTTNGNTIVSPASSEQTYLTLRNIDPSEPVFYSYVDIGESDAIDLLDQGQLLRAGDSVDIEVTESVVLVRSASSVSTDIDCRIDRGQG
jgi:hypothetical protein